MHALVCCFASITLAFFPPRRIFDIRASFVPDRSGSKTLGISSFVIYDEACTQRGAVQPSTPGYA
jgi:hypothetical protein